MAFDLREISYFLAIAEEKTLTGAARKLHLSQPTLSHFLAQLEKELGAPLFYRRGATSLEMTEAGKIYLSGARQIDEVWRGTLDDISESRQGGLSTIRVGTSGAPKFAQTLMRCQTLMTQRYPNAKLHIIASNAADIERQLLKGNFDIGYSAFLPEERRLNYIPLMTSEVDLVVPKDHPLAALAYDPASGTAPRRQPLSVAGDTPFALIYNVSVLRMVEEAYFARCGFRPKVASVYAYPFALKECVTDGNLAGFCPRYQHFEGMARIALDPPMIYTLGVYHRADAPLSAPARYLIELLRDMPFDYDL